MYKTSEMLILGFLLNMFKIWGTLNIKDWVFTYLYMLLRLELEELVNYYRRGRTCMSIKRRMIDYIVVYSCYETVVFKKNK